VGRRRPDDVGYARRRFLVALFDLGTAILRNPVLEIVASAAVVTLFAWGVKEVTHQTIGDVLMIGAGAYDLLAMGLALRRMIRRLRAY
jgi:hypothetical protein